MTQTEILDAIRDKLSTEELLCQLAEECAELSKAALKLRRVLTKVNPTPVTPSEAYANMWEEIFDVTFVLEVLAFDLDAPIMQKFRATKPERWVRRLEGNDAEVH